MREVTKILSVDDLSSSIKNLLNSKHSLIDISRILEVPLDRVRNVVSADPVLVEMIEELNTSLGKRVFDAILKLVDGAVEETKIVETITKPNGEQFVKETLNIKRKAPSLEASKFILEKGHDYDKIGQSLSRKKKVVLHQSILKT